MSTELVLGGLFFFIVIAFLGGLFLLPELFGVSKNEESDPPQNDEKIKK